MSPGTRWQEPNHEENTGETPDAEVSISFCTPWFWLGMILKYPTNKSGEIAHSVTPPLFKILLVIRMFFCGKNRLASSLLSFINYSVCPSILWWLRFLYKRKIEKEISLSLTKYQLLTYMRVWLKYSQKMEVKSAIQQLEKIISLKSQLYSQRC